MAFARAILVAINLPQAAATVGHVTDKVRPIVADDWPFTTRGTDVRVNVLVNVLANDTLPASGRLSVWLVSKPGNGTAVVEADQSVTYTPRGRFLRLRRLHLPGGR